jgi:hypothetical protein
MLEEQRKGIRNDMAYQQRKMRENVQEDSATMVKDMQEVNNNQRKKELSLLKAEHT